MIGIYFSGTGNSKYCLELDVPYEKAFDKLMVKFELGKEEAESAIKKYWKD